MIPEPVYYELGDPYEDGHSHLFNVTGKVFDTAHAKNDSEGWMHVHTIGIVGDRLSSSPGKGSAELHVHEKVRMVRPIG